MSSSLNATLRQMYARWVRIKTRTKIHTTGAGHIIDVGQAQLFGCEIRVSGERNRLEIGPNAKLWGVKLHLIGSDLLCKIGGGTRLDGGHYTLNDSGSRIEIGEQTTMFTAMIVAQEGKSVIVGKDCMFAYGIDLRCSDGHSILDKATGERINPASDLIIEDHVWLGVQSQVLKGVCVSSNSIVASHSVVTKSVPANVVVAGNPARVLRTEVTWDRERLTVS